MRSMSKSEQKKISLDIDEIIQFRSQISSSDCSLTSLPVVSVHCVTAVALNPEGMMGDVVQAFHVLK